jgi:hypothetical protein
MEALRRCVVKAAAAMLAVILLLSGIHITVPVGGYPVAVPLPVLALLAELAVCGVLGCLIARVAGYRSSPYPRRPA